MLCTDLPLSASGLPPSAYRSSTQVEHSLHPSPSLGGVERIGDIPQTSSGVLGLASSGLHWWTRTGGRGEEGGREGVRNHL